MEFRHYVEKSIFYHGHYHKDVLHCKMDIFSGVRVYYNWFPYYNYSWILRLVVNSSIVWIKFSIMDIFIIAARPNIEIIFKCMFTVAAHINCWKYWRNHVSKVWHSIHFEFLWYYPEDNHLHGTKFIPC